MLYITHPNNIIIINSIVKAILQKKDSNPCQIWSDLIYIYEFDDAMTFNLKSILLFWYLDNILENLEKDK